MSNRLALGESVSFKGNSGYTAEFRRYDLDYSALVQPERMYVPEGISAYFHWNSYDYHVNTRHPEYGGLSFLDIQNWFGVDNITDDLYLDLHNFWGYAQTVLKDFDIYALVCSGSGDMNDLDTIKYSAINVKSGIKTLNGRYVFGYIFPKEVLNSVGETSNYLEYRGRKAFTNKYKRDIQNVAKRIGFFTSIKVSSFTIYNSDGEQVVHDMFVYYIDTDSFKNYLKDSYSEYGF